MGADCGRDDQVENRPEDAMNRSGYQDRRIWKMPTEGRGKIGKGQRDRIKDCGDRKIQESKWNPH